MRDERRLPFAFMGVLTLLVAGLTHFVAILILPSVATGDAYSRLSARFGTSSGMMQLPPSRPGEDLIPFRDPATVQAVCLFDLTKAPLRVRAKTDDDRLLTLSFRASDGRIFYAMTNRAALKATIDIRLVSATQLKDIEAADTEDQSLPSELRLKAPALKGLVVATALVMRSSEALASRAQLKAISCAPEPITPPS